MTAARNMGNPFMETAEFCREKAAHCRRLAGAIISKTDPTRVGLLAMAVEFDLKAAAIEAEKVTSLAVKTAETSAQGSDGDDQSSTP